MTILNLLGIWVVWLIIAAIILRFSIGGAIECFKKGRNAKFIDWMGLASLITIILILVEIL